MSDKSLILLSSLPASDQLVVLVNDLVNKPFVSHYDCIEFFKKNWPLKSNKRKFDIHELDITEHIGNIKQNYARYGIIVLRKYNGEKYCTIGCGHKPLLDCGGYSFQTCKEQEEYQTKHCHDGHYTINPEMAYNPSIVGFFSDQEFKTIPNESFIEIYIEGVYLDPTEKFFSELLRMLKPNGQVFDNGTEFLVKRIDPEDGESYLETINDDIMEELIDHYSNLNVNNAESSQSESDN